MFLLLLERSCAIAKSVIAFSDLAIKMPCEMFLSHLLAQILSCVHCFRKFLGILEQREFRVSVHSVIFSYKLTGWVLWQKISAISARFGLSLNDTAMNGQVRFLLQFEILCVLSCFAKVKQHAQCCTRPHIQWYQRINSQISAISSQDAESQANVQPQIPRASQKGPENVSLFSSLISFLGEVRWPELRCGLGPKNLEIDSGFSCLLLSSGSGVWPTVP